MWARAVEGAFANVTLTPRPEKGDFRLSQAADAMVIEVASGPHQVHLRHPTRSLEGMWAVLLQVEGESELRADRHRVSLRPGSAVVLCPDDELCIDLDHYRQRIIIVPRTAMAAPALLRPLHADDPRLRALHAVAAAPASAPVTPWVRLALSPQVRLRRALEWIEGHLDAPPDEVARAQRISRRGLDALFAEHGLTIAHALWEARLREARALLLLEPTLRVVDVALRSGFQTEAHFSRRFRARFGVTPSQARTASVERLDGGSVLGAQASPREATSP
jgi:AraC-like DNA-binding protein